jgi:ribonuclease-3
MPGERRRQRLRALLALCGVATKRIKAFDAAFVHESAVREKLAEQSNERLEFLGDAVLGFAVARSLYERYAAAPEGELGLRKAALVADSALAVTARRLGFEELLVLGAGLAKLPPARRRSSLGDAFEAFVAVLYRECGMDVAADFVVRQHVEPFERAGPGLEDPKSQLQEWTQRRFARTPTYTDHFEGPDHERTFFSEVNVEGEALATGSGPSKKAAQRAAAANALEVLAGRHEDLTPRALTEPNAPPANGRQRPRRNVVVRET